jgi:hypothetical protein
VLGKGNFGKVEKAILLKDDRTENVVAVKMIKGMIANLLKKCEFWSKYLNLYLGSS